MLFTLLVSRNVPSHLAKCSFDAVENQLVRLVDVQHRSHRRWCSEHFCKARGRLGDGSENAIGVN